MRGDETQPGSMFSYVPLEKRIPRDHPLTVAASQIGVELPPMSIVTALVTLA